MDILSGLSIAWKILTLIGTPASEYEAEKAATAYLIEKYNLSPVQSVTYGVITQYGTGEHRDICDATWEQGLASVLRIIMASTNATKEAMAACGDLSMFMIVLHFKYRDRVSEAKWRAGYSMWRVSKDGARTWHTIGRDTETFKSLAEMGRGRGSDLALDIVKSEIQEWLRDPELNSIRAQVEEDTGGSRE